MKITIVQAADRKWTAHFIAANGEIVWSTGSQRYNKKPDAVEAVKLIHDFLWSKTRQYLLDEIIVVSQPKPSKKKAKCQPSKKSCKC